jgi:hypothetical protein
MFNPPFPSRYCGSPDVARSGFGYNARGIARRYRCNNCQREFSIPHTEAAMNGKPVEIVWLLDEVGLLTAKLTDLLRKLIDKLELPTKDTSGA